MTVPFRTIAPSSEAALGQRLHEALLLVQRRNRKAQLALASPRSAVDSIALSIITSIDSLLGFCPRSRKIADFVLLVKS
jgi:hypothetical protein